MGRDGLVLPQALPHHEARSEAADEQEKAEPGPHAGRIGRAEVRFDARSGAARLAGRILDV